MVITVGILALQGGFESHFKMVEALGVKALFIRSGKDFSLIDGLILPGGESTTMNALLEFENLRDPLFHFACMKPVFGTCAGMILLSQMKLLQISVKRNAYGNQQSSFSTEVSVDFGKGKKNIKAIFIRAPKIDNVESSKVKVLASFEGTPVLVENHLHLAASFHPELTDDLTVHQFFLNKIKKPLL